MRFTYRKQRQVSLLQLSLVELMLEAVLPARTALDQQRLDQIDDGRVSRATDEEAFRLFLNLDVDTLAIEVVCALSRFPGVAFAPLLRVLVVAILVIVAPLQGDAKLVGTVQSHQEGA